MALAPLAGALGRALRHAAAPAASGLAWLLAGYILAMGTALGALGFAVAGLYLAGTERLGLTPMEAAFGTAAILAVASAVAVLCLRSCLYGSRRPEAATPDIAEEARRSVAAVEGEAARLIRERPAASVLACLAAGVIVGALKDRNS